MKGLLKATARFVVKKETDNLFWVFLGTAIISTAIIHLSRML